MEQLVLKVLNFDLAVPTILLFVTKFSKVLESNEETLNLALVCSEFFINTPDFLLIFIFP